MVLAADRGLSICGRGGCTVTTDWSGDGQLIYAAIAPLDGYLEDEEAGPSGGCRMRMCMRSSTISSGRSAPTYTGAGCMRRWCFWETASTEADEPAVFWDYAGIWRATEKIVYSRTLQTVSSARTPIEREFDRDALRRSSSPRGRHRNRGCRARWPRNRRGAGRRLPSVLCPIVVGGGKHALPDKVRAQLELLDERRFRNGVVHLHYRVSV
jgi:hypothetical protein